MLVRYDITHSTTYRYRSEVTFGEHRVMFRPRESHDLRVLATDLKVSPEAEVRMIQDQFSNSVALVTFLAPASTLEIVCSFTIEYAHGSTHDLPLLPIAEIYPFAYSMDERLDLEHYLRPHYEDPEGKLTHWARQFLRTDGPTGTRAMLIDMNQAIRDQFSYAARDAEGTQPPTETLALGSGTCRDFALLMMEACRQLGIAARFVSGYLYDPALDRDSDNDQAVTGAGVTHAWLQTYLPGAGWVAFDPTNNLLGGDQLVRVGVARDPRQASPVSGSWSGAGDAFEGLSATVQVRRLPVSEWL